MSLTKMSPAMADLIGVLNRQIIDAITHVDGKPRFTYMDGYSRDPDATPLSLSMPLARNSSQRALKSPAITTMTTAARLDVRRQVCG
jgi:HipA-like protein